MADRVVLISIPQLRHRDVTPGALASLEALSRRGSLAELVPAFPGQAAPSFATLMTGVGPREHGLIGDTYYDRAERRIASRPLPDSAVLAPKLWDHLRSARPGSRTLLWFAPNSHGASVDLAAWSESDTSLATRPSGLAADLVNRFGPFPIARPAVEPPRLETTAWILKTAAAVIAAELPDLAVVRVPYLGQIARRFGPDGRQASRSLWELEAALGPFLRALPPRTLILAVTESVSTPVSGPVFPNRTLRGLGLLSLKPGSKGGLDVDLAESAAFALADHQICQIYLNDPTQTAPVASTFSGPESDGVARVASGRQRAALGMDHPRAGDVILIASPNRWFAPDWWDNPREMPKGTEGVSGLAQGTPQGLLDPSHVKGSLGAPTPNEEYLGVIVASEPDVLGPLPQIAARDVARLVLRALAISLKKSG